MKSLIHSSTTSLLSSPLDWWEPSQVGGDFCTQVSISPWLWEVNPNTYQSPPSLKKSGLKVSSALLTCPSTWMCWVFLLTITWGRFQSFGAQMTSILGRLFVQQCGSNQEVEAESRLRGNSQGIGSSTDVICKSSTLRVLPPQLC